MEDSSYIYEPHFYNQYLREYDVDENGEDTEL